MWTVHHSARVPRAGGDEPTAGGPRLVGARCSVLVPVAVDSAAPLHWGDECDRREGVRQAWVRQLWKARPQHRGPRLVCDDVGPPPAVPLHSMRGTAQHEHGDRVPRSSLQSTGVRPGREPTSRGRQHFCDRPSDGPFPHHHRAMARASRDSCRVLQSPAAARFRRH